MQVERCCKAHVLVPVALKIKTKKRTRQQIFTSKITAACAMIRFDRSIYSLDVVPMLSSYHLLFNCAWENSKECCIDFGRIERISRLCANNSQEWTICKAIRAAARGNKHFRCVSHRQQEGRLLPACRPTTQATPIAASQ